MREGCPCDRAGVPKGPFSFAKENGPFGTPRERLLIGSLRLECPFCLRNETACARQSRVSIAIRFASAPIIRCRSAHLVEVRSNHRLPPVPTMRRAQQCRYFASSLPPSKRHSRLTIVRRGCWMCRNVGIHGEAMYTALTLRSACSSSSHKLPMCGVEGEGPSSLSLGGGVKGDVLFPMKENIPTCRIPTRCGAITT